MRAKPSNRCASIHSNHSKHLATKVYQNGRQPRRQLSHQELGWLPHAVAPACGEMTAHGR
jgi:hypothetical protein